MAYISLGHSKTKKNAKKILEYDGKQTNLFVIQHQWLIFYFMEANYVTFIE